MAQRDYLTIGQVVKRLEGTYPDLTASKIRYLEDEGLIEPRRTPGGYRKFSDADVERLSTILRLQKTTWYPLDVIKRKLDEATERGEEVANIEGGGTEPDLRELADRKHPIENMPQLINVDIGFVRRLSESGLITLARSPKGLDLVDGGDLPLIRSCFALSRYGMQPRHLKTFLTSINRESTLFEQVLSNFTGGKKMGESADAGERKRFVETYDNLEGLVDEVRSSLLKRHISQRFGDMGL